jgi:dipeptidyl aminopeptidase/acylaminoacyl peptidase
VVPVDSSKLSKNLTQKFDLHASSMTINDVGSPEQMRPTWSNDGRQIFFQVAYHGSSLLKRISLEGRDLQDIVGEGGVVGSYSFDRTQSKLAYFFGQMHDPGQVHLRELGSGTTRHLTRVNRELLDTISLPRVEEVWFKNPDGLSLQGWIMYPPRFDPKRKYPSILEIHGGPQTQYGKFFMHEFNYFASNGYVVYFSNPRGGRGYGEAHTKAIWGDWGNADYIDVMALAEMMARKPYIDKNRMGVTGGSYGGYMTLWIIGHNDFFKPPSQRCVATASASVIRRPNDLRAGTDRRSALQGFEEILGYVADEIHR